MKQHLLTRHTRKFYFDTAAEEFGWTPITQTVVAAGAVIAMASATFRFVFSRVFGRVN